MTNVNFTLLFALEKSNIGNGHAAAKTATDKALNMTGWGLMSTARKTNRYRTPTGRKKSARFETCSLSGALAGMGKAFDQFEHGRVRGQVPA